MKTNIRMRTTANLFVLIAMILAALGMPIPALAAQPANDIITSAVPITTMPSTITMSDVDFYDADNGAGDPDVCGYGNPGVQTIWYTFTPSTYGKLSADTFGSGFDTILAVWKVTGGVLEAVACNDDDQTGLHSRITNVQLKAGTKYYLEVVQFTSNEGAPQKEQNFPVDPALVANYMTLNVSFSQDLTVAVPGVRYDDKNTIFTYTGAWLTASTTRAYEKGFKYSKTIGNSATLTFDGNKFKLYYTKGSTYGMLDVFLDGETVTPFVTINQNSSTTAYQQVYTSPEIPDGIHTLQFKHKTRYVNIDAIEFFAPPDLVPPSAISDLVATAGGTFGSVNLQWTATGDDGMDGSARSYVVRYAVTPITNETQWNAARTITKGVPTPPKPAGQTEAMAITGLSPGVTYYFAVRVLDEVAPDATPSDISNSASVLTTAPTPSGVGTYDNEEDKTKWNYFGTWTTVSNTYATRRTFHQSIVIGDSAAFVFTGTKFTFIYLMNSTGGMVEVLLDGAPLTTLNQKGTTKFNVRYSYTVTPGTHTVQFVLLSGTKIYVDGIVIE